jgi:hypothetical protein
MRVVKCLLFVIAMWCIAIANAQVDLRLDSVILGLNTNTIYKDTVYNLSVSIYNDSATTFTGVISIGAAINGQLADTNTISYPTDTAETITHGSFITRPVILNTASFIVGTSGVVIWPIAVSNTQHLTVTIADTIGLTLNVLYPLGIDELSERNLKVYMLGQQLMIKNNGDYLLKNVKLYDVAGKLLLQKEVSVSGMVDMNQYAEGVYFAEINFADNTRAVVKVVNTR